MMVRNLLYVFLFCCACCASSIEQELYNLYNLDSTVIESVEVVSVFATDNEIRKIKNLYKVNELYIEKDSLLSLEIDNYKKDDSCFSKMNELEVNRRQNRFDHLDLIKELDLEVRKCVQPLKESQNEYFIISYIKNNKRKYSVIMDRAFSIIYANDDSIIKM